MYLASFVTVGVVVLLSWVVSSASVTRSQPLDWLSGDINIASQLNFPVVVSNYGLDENSTPNVAYPNIPGEYRGRTKVDGFTWQMLPRNYSRTFPMKSFKLTKNQARSVRSIYVLERSVNGWAHWVHAELVAVGQGSSLTTAIGFANNQVITFSNYLGFDTYSIYPITGITVPK